MTTHTLADTLIESLLLPPGINLLMALAAWMLWNSWRRTARTLLVISATSLYALSTPSVANALRDALPSHPPLTLKQIQELHIDNQTEPTAIVIVSAGRKVKAPEYGDVDTVNAETLELLRYGAYLHRKTKLPIMVVGGSPNGESTPEAVLMNQVLTEEFGVEVLKLLTSNFNNNHTWAEISEHKYTNLILVTNRDCLVDTKSLDKILCSPILSSQLTDSIMLLPSFSNLKVSQHSLLYFLRH